MAKRNKVLPARKPRDRSRDDDSLLLQSAESLGRVIGALQRQLDGATKQLSRRGGDAMRRSASSRSAPPAATAGAKKKRKPSGRTPTKPKPSARGARASASGKTGRASRSRQGTRR